MIRKKFLDELYSHFYRVTKEIHEMHNSKFVPNLTDVEKNDNAIRKDCMESQARNLTFLIESYLDIHSAR